MKSSADHLFVGRCNGILALRSMGDIYEDASCDIRLAHIVEEVGQGGVC